MIEAPAMLLLAWLLGSSRDGGAPPKRNGKNGKRGDIPPAGEQYQEGVWPRAVPKGAEVPIKLTGGIDVAAWRSARWKACIDFLMNDDRSLNAITSLFEHHVIDQSDISMDGIALSVVTHWDIETASGTHEFNYNVGGIAAVPGQQHFNSIDAESGRPAAFCAYDSLQEGIADYFGVLSYDRYVHALAPLLVLPSDPEWFAELGRAGYYGMEPSLAKAALAARRLLVAVDAGVAPNL